MAVSSGTTGGYESFFGLKESPFSLTPNPRFLFESATHRAALEQVTYALGRREPLVVVTGEIGTGKTMLCRTMLQRLERLTFLSVISDPLLERDDLLKQILEDFGVISKGRGKAVQPGRHELVLALQEFLASLIPLQAHAVVMIDEAQHLAPSVLEEIRLLSNIEAEQGTQLQIVLVGQTDLDAVLKRPEMRQFEQRVTRRCRLMPLDAQEVRKYIEHRLEVAQQGREGQVGRESRTGRTLFSADAMDAVAHLSGGLPRVINIICDRALEAAFGLGQQTVERSAVESAARALGLSLPAQPAAPAVPAPTAAERPALPAVPTPPAPPAPGVVGDFDRLFDEAAASAPHHDVAVHSSWSSAKGRPALSNLPERLDLPDPPGPPDLPGFPDPPGQLSDTTFEAPVAESKTRQYVIAGVGIVVIAVAAWFATRGPAAPAAEVPAPAANPSPAPAAATPAVPPATAPTTPATPAAPQAAPSDPPPAASPDAAPSAPGAAAQAATGERFEIVVASFRTESRVLAVAAEVEALGMPHRRRTAGEGWLQVLAGPYSSRADAEAAQRRLDAAGLTGTQIVVR